MRTHRTWRIVTSFAVFFLVASTTLAQQGGKGDDQSPHLSGYVTIKNVRLHYLDWGGTGEALIFLPGAGDTAHVFDEIAPKFTDRFRVLALTRRGHGESDKPEKGYDVDTLTKDLLGFIDQMKINKVHLIGHSFAGNEMLMFAAKYPKRTLKLVFLDAAYGRREQFLATEPRAPRQIAEKTSEAPTLEDKIFEEYNTYGDRFDPDYRRIKAPALSFYVMVEKHWAGRPGMDDALRKRMEEWIETDVRPYQSSNIERFRKEVKHGQAIVLPGTNHYFFRDPKVFEDVVSTIRRFLLETAP
ncbi:MAG: alpha/beta hydrolase [Acidobacteria bacterium]|nr:alpha/beta hydrolase [Acidobacteriota bacterium]